MLSAMLGDFFQLEGAQRADRANELLGERGRHLRNAGQDDGLLAVGVGIVDVQEQAASLQRLGQLAGRVGGEYDERLAGCDDRAELGHGDLEVAEHLEEQSSTSTSALSVSSTSRTVGSSRRIAVSNGRGEEEFLAEDVVVGLFPLLAVTGRLDAQELLAVVPLIQRPGLVQALVALEPDEPGVGGLRDRLG